MDVPFLLILIGSLVPAFGQTTKQSSVSHQISHNQLPNQRKRGEKANHPDGLARSGKAKRDISTTFASPSFPDESGQVQVMSRKSSCNIATDDMEAVSSRPPRLVFVCGIQNAEGISKHMLLTNRRGHRHEGKRAGEVEKKAPTSQHEPQPTNQQASRHQRPTEQTDDEPDAHMTASAAAPRCKRSQMQGARGALRPARVVYPAMRIPSAAASCQRSLSAAKAVSGARGRGKKKRRRQANVDGVDPGSRRDLGEGQME